MESKESDIEENKSCCGHANKPDSVAEKFPDSVDTKYYCPMHCEGEKTYEHHGNCPKCGMDLLPTIPIDNVDQGYQNLLKKFKIAVFFTVPIFVVAMVEMIPHNPISKFIPHIITNWLQFILSLPVVFYAAWMLFQRAWSSFQRKSLNMFSLIGLGSTAAFVFSFVALLVPDIFPSQFKGHGGTVFLYFEAVTVILTFVLFGQVLEARAHSKTSSAIKELLNLTPNEAIVVVNGIETVISINEIKKGDILRIKPGDKIPVDGEIIEGEGVLDESMITGEPIPVDKLKGDKVSSGTVNGTKSFLMKAERIGSETLLSQIIHLVNEASRSEAPIQKIADTISKYFVPIVIVISLLTFGLWSIFGPEPRLVFGFVNSLAVLIIACPCALGLATPISVMVGVGKGAQNGILVKNAESLEKLNKIDVLIIDKTGTITEGKPSLDQVITLDANREEVLIFAASLSQRSEHPLGKAVVDAAQLEGLKILMVDEFETIVGKGVIGKVENKKILLGNSALLTQFNVGVPNRLSELAQEEQKKGKTVSFVAVKDIVLGIITIHDAIKSSSRKALREIMDKGIEVVMLTGDNQYTANAIAKELGLDSFQSECLPQDKLKVIKNYQSKGKIVAMAGDGINDAPALAQADIGIAMGTGTDVAIESAGITLLKGDLQGIVKAIELSKGVMSNIKQNLFFAFGYNVIGIPVAAGLLYPFFGILLSPMIAATAMSFSSVSVIMNALRLRRMDLN